MGRVIGLLGGIGSGKSTVARLFSERGVAVLDADRHAREVLASPAIVDALVARFGSGILDDRGAIDRAALARVAFADEAATADLNALVHPEVRRRLLDELAASGDRTVVLDVPLLLESPLAERVGIWVFVEASDSQREARVAARNWPAGERRRREARQADLAAKRRRADYVLENSGSIDHLGRQVDALLLQIGAS
jgi:dephospho-CoA kinase